MSKNKMLVPFPPTFTERKTTFDPSGPNLTSEKKLYNIKKKVEEMKRFVDEISHSLVTPVEVVRFAHIVKAALAEIEREVDRTV